MWRLARNDIDSQVEAIHRGEGCRARAGTQPVQEATQK